MCCNKTSDPLTEMGNIKKSTGTNQCTALKLCIVLLYIKRDSKCDSNGEESNSVLDLVGVYFTFCLLVVEQVLRVVFQQSTLQCSKLEFHTHTILAFASKALKLSLLMNRYVQMMTHMCHEDL